MQDYAPLLERAFSFMPREQSYVVEDIDGKVPEFVRGTYYLNGPARFSRGSFRYNHWLDGDGMVCALRFLDGRVEFTSRFIRSPKLVAEEEVGRPLFRAFGTAFGSDRLKRGIMLESPVNVSVYPYAGTLLAFGEQGLPIELDPTTLETRGGFDFSGAINDVTPFAAHPKIDPLTGELFNFGIAFAATEPYLNLYRFDAAARLIFRKRLSLEYPGMVHDFGLSQNHVVFYLSPYILDMKAFVHDGQTLLDSLKWEPKRGSVLLIASRETGERVKLLPIGSRHCLHFINCFEENGLLNIDVLELERPIFDQYQQVPNLFTDVCEGRPVRFIVDLKSAELIETSAVDYQLAPDFPTLNPSQATQPYSNFWMLGISTAGRRGRKFFDQLVHVAWPGKCACDVYQAPAQHYLCGEPIFIQGGGVDGAVICQMFDAAKESSAFALFDASHVARGPVALLRLNDPVHLGFHASFAAHNQH
ncbi:MAG TPA: carotenoid oxygenase family protein [Pyrinomonadaceae bacterium]|nr:carotenoid oxygenase family protein [Pyrinomonadaceae bacterium]